MDKENKKRSPNFNNTELEILKTLCTKYFAIIESKKSDAVSWQAKSAQWEKIASEFNSQNTIHRCSKVLRKKWENIKKLVKDKVAGHRRHAVGTGGGPPLPELKLNKWEEEIFNLIQISAVGLPSEFDDDTVIQPGPVVPIVSQDNINTPDVIWEDAQISTYLREDDILLSQDLEIEHVRRPEHDSVPPEKNDVMTEEKEKKDQEKQTWASYNPNSLRTPMSDSLQLRRYRKRPFTGTMTNKAWLELAEEKKKITQLKAKKLEKDCQLQDALLVESKLRSEELSLKIELLKQEIKNKKNII